MCWKTTQLLLNEKNCLLKRYEHFQPLSYIMSVSVSQNLKQFNPSIKRLTQFTIYALHGWPSVPQHISIIYWGTN